MSGSAVAIVATILLILVNALYVFHEFSFVTMRPDEARQFEREGTRIGRLIARGVHELDHYLAVDQLGITASSIAVGWIGQPAIADLLGGLFGLIGPLGGGTAGVIGAVVAFALITGAQVVVGELMPKTVALRHATAVARLVVVPVEVTARVMRPVVAVLNGAGRLVVRLLGFEPQAEATGEALPPSELVDIIAQSARAGAVRLDPRTVRRALRFSELEARDLMVPRHEVVGLEAGLSLDRVLELARRARHLRYPVYERELDNVVGMLNLKDVVAEQPPGEVVIDADWRKHVRPVVTLPETASIETLVRAFKQDRQQFAVLVDEFGTLAGVITVEDVADHLLGLPEGIARVRPWEFVVDGDTALAVVDDELQLALSPADGSYETVGGLVMAHTGDIPSVGDRVTVDGTEITVLEMEGLRVGKVRITVTPVAEGRAEELRSG